MELEDVVKVHSVGYGLEEVKVEFKHDLKMDVSGVKIEGKESEIMNIPRWVAEILESDKHIIIHEEDMLTELLNELVRIRQGKIVRLADSSALTSDLSSKLSVEEEVYYNEIHKASLEFKKQVVGNKK